MVVLAVAEHHRLAERGSLAVNAAIGALGAAWIVSGVLQGYRGSRFVARLVWRLLAVSVVAVGVSSARTASAGVQPVSSQPDHQAQAWQQLSAISTTDTGATSAAAEGPARR